MVASRRVTKPSSAEGFGETDFAKVDAHEIQPHEYDELPELTDEMLARSVHSNGSAELSRAVESLLKRTLELDSDVAAGLQASGRGWEERSNAVLREWLNKRSA